VLSFWPPFSSKIPRLRKADAPALVAAVICLAVVVTGFVLDQRNTEAARDELRATTESTGGFLSRRLTMRAERDFLTGEYLVHTLSDGANFAAERLKGSVEEVLRDNPHISMVAFAPNFQVETTFTRKGMAREFDDIADDGIRMSQLAADLKSVDGRNRVSLLSGSQEGHLTLVIPVWPGDQRADLPSGALALVVNETAMMEASGVSFSGRSPARAGQISLDWLAVAIRDADKPDHLAFFGDDAVEDMAPISWTLPIKGANWRLLAAPRSGWNIPAPNRLHFRLALLLGGLAIIIPVLITSSLIGERNRNIAALKARETNLLELSKRFNLAMEASNIGIWEVTQEGDHLYWDARAAGLHGQPVGGAVSRLNDWLDCVLPEDRAAAEAHFFNCTCTDSPCSEVYRVRLPDGSLRHLRSAGANYKNEAGSRRTTGIVWDVTGDVMMTQTLRDAKENTDIKNAELELALDELSQREQELDLLSNKLDLALASYGCGIWEFNPATGLETWDERMCQLYGIPYTDGQMKQQQWLDLMLPEDREDALKASRTYIQGETDEALLVRVPQADGTLRYIRSVGQVQMARDGSRKLIGIAVDVTKDAVLTAELKAAKDEADAKNAELELAKTRIEHNSLHDPLTMLANRRKLDMQLDQLSRSSHTERQKFSILHLDLDRFKQINDTLGHAAGDAMLVHASRILARNVRGMDLVARIGGDEFVIVATGSSSAEEMAQLSQRIIGEFHQPIDFEGFSCRCGVSIGIAQASGMNIDARRVLVNADIALYRAKGLGRNRYEFFTQNLQAEIINHKRTADEVLAGIDNDEFTTWYQPQFCARTNEISGVEALIRWNHPHHGVLAPGRFLKIAEDLNVSAALDQIVLETVLKDKLRWLASGLKVPKVSVNVSSKRLHDDALIDTLTRLNIPAGEISFELVESIFLDESEQSASSNLDRIKALGIDIEIDDFGTGHTSIVSLLKLKPKRLKIDRQLVMPITNSPQERALVRSIIEIARSLGVETVAEGVETMQHADLLRDLGCDHLQGYAFARPLSFSDFHAAASGGWQRAAA
jgi:diguanylate cyclase (GGDEF)-like protein/PAS domain S-box-containing protein